MFHFPATPQRTLYIQARATGHQTGQVTPFGNPGITVQLATPPGISQPHTSFIGHPAPRHPPCALHNLTEHQSNQVDTKTLTHTIQISNNTPAAPDTTTTPHRSNHLHAQQPNAMPQHDQARDVLPQNPNRVQDPPAHQKADQQTSRMINAQSTHQKNNQSIHTRATTPTSTTPIEDPDG